MRLSIIRLSWQTRNATATTSPQSHPTKPPHKAIHYHRTCAEPPMPVTTRHISRTGRVVESPVPTIDTADIIGPGEVR